MVEIVEIIGWISTVLFVLSFVVKDRVTLHGLGAVACVFKLIYSYHHQVWPLFVNWVILIIVQVIQVIRLRAQK